MYSFFNNRAFYEKMWINILGFVKPQMTIWLMRIAFWTTKATHTQSECVILNALQLQQWLHERVSMWRTLPAFCIQPNPVTVCIPAAPWVFSQFNASIVRN